MSLPKRVVLVGPMGAGKSTIGRMLAKELGYRFLDSDRIIEERCGANIPWIFDVEGESGFRLREIRMIERLSAKQNVVLATGGGAVLAAENRACLSSRGVVVYLRASIAQQVERTSRDRNRPLLQTDDPESKIRELMAIRDPLYLEVADIIVDTNRRNPKSVSHEISKQLDRMVKMRPESNQD